MLGVFLFLLMLFVLFVLLFFLVLLILLILLILLVLFILFNKFTIQFTLFFIIVGEDGQILTNSLITRLNKVLIQF